MKMPALSKPMSQAVLQKLRDVRAWGRALFEHNHDAVVILDPSGRIVEANPAAARLTGRSVAELRGCSLWKLVPRADRAAVVAACHATSSGTPQPVRTTIARRNGRPRHVEVTRGQIVSDGTVWGGFAVLRDVTAEERALQELRLSEERYRMMLEAAPMLAWRCDEKAGAIDCNQRWYEYTGQTPEQARGNGWMQAVHPEDRPRTLQRVRHVAATGEYYETEYRLRRAADGQYRWHLARALPFRDAKGRVIHWFGYATDIEDQKRAEAILRENEKRYRLFMESIPVPAWRTDARGRLVDANRAWYVYTGQTVAEDGQHWLFAIHPADRPSIRRALRQPHRRGQMHQVECRLRRRDGRYRWHLLRAFAHREPAGAIIGWFGTCTDIHDQRTMRERLQQQVQERTRKLAQANVALRESERRYRSLVERAPVGIAVLVRGRVAFCNQQCAQIFGARSPRAMIGRRADLLVVPSQQARARQRIRLLSRGRRLPAHSEYQVRRRDGSLVTIETQAVRVAYQGQPALQIIVRDVTERRRMEDALRTSEERFRQIAAHVPTCFWILRVPDGSIEYVSPAFETIWGRPREPLARLPAIWWRSVLREDRPRAAAMSRGALARHGYGEAEYRIRRADGAIRWIWEKANPIRDDAGRLVRVVGTSRDITERKVLEQELLAISERERRGIAQELHDGLAQHLAGVAYLSQMLAERLRTAGHAEAATADRISELLHRGMTDARRMARGLYAVRAEPAGLRLALAQLAEQTTSLFHQPCQFRCRGQVVVGDPEAAQHLFRIAQEAVRNAVRHARARQITISLSQHAGLLRLRVRDDGIGLPRRCSSQGMGLAIMQHRADLIGATLRIRRAPTGGTIVSCDWRPQQ